MSEAATSFDVLEGIFAVDEDDEVHLAVDDYEWANPYEVVDVDHVEWDGATGETWATRVVIVEGGYSSTFSVTAIEGDADLELRKHPGGQKRGDLERFEPVDDDRVEDESGTSAEDNSTSDSVSEAEPADVLEEAAADDAPGPSTEYLETVNEVLDGDDVQEEITVDEDDDNDSVELPDGVTEDLVDELTSGGIEIGSLAEELGVHRNRARTIVFDLGFYKRVREVWRDRERASIDPRIGGLLVVVIGLVTIGLIAVGVTYP
ncbi:hypothetical protein [Natrinema salaciae]|uniref:Uncharacterized protein n=1 Tax=Natrinema salaciae TaxID=1186196 RepID=A0A1H9ET62_9EURY|nr:hypothetical protein [Natrinema salaciae]SEQ28443.1 hypothetical protein SAMN04489841_1367 [Natrinema salaciae]